MPPSFRQRRFLSMKQKIEIIDFAEHSKLRVRRLALMFGVGKSQMAEILRKKDEIRRSYVENENPQRKKMFPTKRADLNRTVYAWFSQLRRGDVRVSGYFIKSKALEVARDLGMREFKASNGWLEKFCRRWNISLRSIRDEAVERIAFEEIVIKEEWRDEGEASSVVGDV